MNQPLTLPLLYKPPPPLLYYITSGFTMHMLHIHFNLFTLVSRRRISYVALAASEISPCLSDGLGSLSSADRA